MMNIEPSHPSSPDRDQQPIGGNGAEEKNVSGDFENGSLKEQESCSSYESYGANYGMICVTESGPAWQLVQQSMAGIPWWILTLAVLGVVPVIWIIVLGVDQLLQRFVPNL